MRNLIVRIHYGVFVVPLFFSCCTFSIYTNIKSTVKDSTLIIAEPVAIAYTKYNNLPTANKVTALLVESLKKCKNIKQISPDSMENLLYSNKITLPDRLTKFIMSDLATKLNLRYILISQLGEWRDVDFKVKRGPRVGITLLLYDLQRQELIWSCTGSGEGNFFDGTVQASHKIETELELLLEKMLGKWPNFCRP
jgi:hypothetical protein